MKADGVWFCLHCEKEADVEGTCVLEPHVLIDVPDAYVQLLEDAFADLRRYLGSEQDRVQELEARLQRLLQGEVRAERCTQCGGELSEPTPADYTWTPGVVLVGVPTRTCEECGDKEAAIQTVDALTRAIEVHGPGRYEHVDGTWRKLWR